MAEAAVNDYIASHPAWVRYRVTGEIASGLLGPGIKSFGAVVTAEPCMYLSFLSMWR